MYARVTTIEGAADRMDDAKRHTREQTLPQLQKMDGIKGFVALGDRQSGKLLGVAFWESEEALRATEQAVSSVRSGAAEASSGTVAGVEQYEVFVYEAPSAGPVSGVTDTQWAGSRTRWAGPRAISWEAGRRRARIERAPTTDARRRAGA